MLLQQGKCTFNEYDQVFSSDFSTPKLITKIDKGQNLFEVLPLPLFIDHEKCSFSSQIT